LNPTNQLLAVWNALAIHNDREGLDLVPLKPTGNSCELYFYDGQTGDCDLGCSPTGMALNESVLVFRRI
jgi:hypothetical protein